MIDEKELQEIKNKFNDGFHGWKCDGVGDLVAACESLMEENKKLQSDNNRLEREAQEKRELYLNEIDKLELKNACLKEDLGKLQSLVNKLAKASDFYKSPQDYADAKKDGMTGECLWIENELLDRLLAESNHDHIPYAGVKVEPAKSCETCKFGKIRSTEQLETCGKCSANREKYDHWQPKGGV